MGFRYPKKVIFSVSVVAALLGATVLLGGYANIKPAVMQAPAKCCSAAGSCCPGGAQTASYQPTMAAQIVSTDDSGRDSAVDCPKLCCAGDVAEDCDNPSCPKPCCVDETLKGCCGTPEETGCPISAAENNVQ